MVHYQVLCVGRRARDPLLDAAEGYQQRLKHYARVTLTRVREGTLESEAKALAARLWSDACLVVLDERGQQLSTKELAAQARVWEQQGPHKIAMVLGGADGLAPDLLSRAQRRVSLSRLTLPHRLALVVLLEQLYRAHTMLRGEKYHRA